MKLNFYALFFHTAVEICRPLLVKPRLCCPCHQEKQGEKILYSTGKGRTFFGSEDIFFSGDTYTFQDLFKG